MSQLAVYKAGMRLTNIVRLIRIGWCVRVRNERRGSSSCVIRIWGRECKSRRSLRVQVGFPARLALSVQSASDGYDGEGGIYGISGEEATCERLQIKEDK